MLRSVILTWYSPVRRQSPLHCQTTAEPSGEAPPLPDLRQDNQDKCSPTFILLRMVH